MSTIRPHRRVRHLAVVPVLLAALAGLAACGGAENPAEPSQAQDELVTPTSPPEDTAEAGTSLALTADRAAAGKCAVPSAETLSTFDTAFEGTVTSLGGGTATLSVDTWYAGDEAATVTVAAPSKDLQELLMAVSFEQGKTYLVSAEGGRVTLCGFTAETSPDLRAMYAAAFSG